MDELIERDAHLRFKPGDDESRAFVDEQVRKMKTRSSEIAFELEKVNRRLDELGVPRRPESGKEPQTKAAEPETKAEEPAVDTPDEAPQRLPPTP
jgi:hypothetical protein